MDEVKVETNAGVMTVTLADVDNRNALGAALIGRFMEALQSANADPAVRAVVVTNEGNTFCAGANLKEQSSAKPQSKGMGSFDELLKAIQQSPTPVIGRIAGHVVGGGNGLASAMDISIAAADVKFGFTEVRLGVVPAIISVVCLPKMRRGDALEAFLRGNRFPATRAAELGLINRAVPAENLDEAVAEVLADLRKGGPIALGKAKRLVYDVPAMSTDDAFRWTSQLSAELFASEEAAEGMQAFLSRSKPSWAEEGRVSPMLQEAQDLRAEARELGELLATLDESDWQTSTQFMSWTPWDVVAHLHYFDWVSTLSLQGEEVFVPLRDQLVEAMLSGRSNADIAREKLGDLSASRTGGAVGRDQPGAGASARRVGSETPIAMVRSRHGRTHVHHRPLHGDLGARSGDLRSQGNRAHPQRPHQEHRRDWDEDFRVDLRGTAAARFPAIRPTCT